MLPTIVIASIIVAACVAVAVKGIINKKKGKSSCSCGCSCGACPVSGSCGMNNQSGEDKKK